MVKAPVRISELEAAEPYTAGKKVGPLPVKGSDKEKQTNEIKIAIPLLDSLDIQGKTAKPSLLTLC